MRLRILLLGELMNNVPGVSMRLTFEMMWKILPTAGGPAQVYVQPAWYLNVQVLAPMYYIWSSLPCRGVFLQLPTLTPLVVHRTVRRLVPYHHIVFRYRLAIPQHGNLTLCTSFKLVPCIAL